MAAVGIAWVNNYHGRWPDLKNNKDNARGFLRRIDAVAVCELGNDNATDADFEHAGQGSPAQGSDSLFADTVDLVYFSGHGNAGGAQFGNATRDDGIAAAGELRLGAVCKWLVFDACDVLAEFPGESPAQHFATAFEGLHYVLGFASICGDSDDRGRLFADKLNDGQTIRDAWIRSAQETEDDEDRLVAYVRTDGESLRDQWPAPGRFVSGIQQPEITHGKRSC